MLRFFIDRPIFSSVISIIILLAGGAAYVALPVEQYPDVVPPQVRVSAMFPGASAEVITESVASVLEQEITGVDNMIFMESVASDAGTLRITVSFAMGTDPDQATINVNNRVGSALPRLPLEVRNLGVRTEAGSTSILLVPVLYSPNGSYDALFLSNYAVINLLDELNRLPGVGDASLFGPQDYSMRIWTNPDKLAQYGLSVFDVISAIREQNVQFAAGRIGGQPISGDDHYFTFTVDAPRTFSTAEEFEAIILRSGQDGEILRLGDVARAELGSQSYDFDAVFNGQPTAPIGIYLAPGANALDTAKLVKQSLEEASQLFPADLAYTIGYDTTTFIELSIREVLISLALAVLLVALFTYLFLQNVRATLVPVAAIPVSLIGTFAGMAAFGFSINLLTLFGLVLAIGIVVDNAIIVMENVERLMAEEDLSAYDASVKTMTQVIGAIISSTQVLVAVFAPVAFLGGLTGELYRQFAVTIAVSIVVSGVVSVTLSPAMCALLLKKRPEKVAKPFEIFNKGFDATTSGFVKLVGVVLRRPALGLLSFFGIAAIAVLLVSRLPGGLVPQEDQGVLMVAYQLPPGSALQQTIQSRDALSDQVREIEDVYSLTAVAGFDLVAFALRSNAGVGFVDLTDWSERRRPDQQASAIARQIIARGFGIDTANVIAFQLPPIPGLSLTGGVEGYLQMTGDVEITELDARARRLVAEANQRPELMNVRSTLDASIPRFRATIDREKARSAGVPIAHVFQTMQASFGSAYVNDFVLAGRNWQVNVSAEGDFRRTAEGLNNIFVRSVHGEMLPLASLIHLELVSGADVVNRFNNSAAAFILGDPAPGYTSAQAMQVLDGLVDELFEDGRNRIGWIGEAFQIQAAAGTGNLVFALGLVMVFLILAAQYERWTLPIAVLSAVPFGMLGAALAAMLRGLPNDIYFQVGLLVLIGLAAKNAILIVEFAAQNRRAGMDPIQAALTSVSQRFRAIMLTASTFIAGTMPLVLATGAGSASRQAIGAVVVGGMIFASTLAMVYVPLIFKLFEDLAGGKKATSGDLNPAEATDA